MPFQQTRTPESAESEASLAAVDHAVHTAIFRLHNKFGEHLRWVSNFACLKQHRILLVLGCIRIVFRSLGLSEEDFGFLQTIGVLGPEDYLPDALGLARDGRSNVKTPPDGYHAGAGKLFTAGDMRRGQSLVVWAIAEGRAAAREVDEYLMGYSN